MGKFKKGILGGFSGKVGNVVGAKWKGIDVLRSLPTKSSKPATEKQIRQRVKFMTARHFIAPFNVLVSKYFGSNSPYMTKMNQCLSYNMREAIIELDDYFIVDYQRALISKGDLLGMQGATMTAMDDYMVQVQWQNNAALGNAKANDMLVVTLYNPMTNLLIISEHAAERSTTELVIDANAINSGETLEVWGFFVAANGSHYSTSNYLGQVTIS